MLIVDQLVDRLIGALSPRAALRRADRLAEEGRLAPAFRLYARAAKAGLAEAEFKVARCYLEGRGVPTSAPEAARWLERASIQGCVAAQTELAALYVRGLANARGVSATKEDHFAHRLFSEPVMQEPDFEAATSER